jgi:hypothetical protein
MYSPPEVRELGTVSAFTLGSTTGGTIPFTKVVNTTSDALTGVFTSKTGSPCTIGPGIPCG